MSVPDPPALVPARFHDLVRPGRLFLWGFAFWTGVAFLFAVQHALLGAHFGRPEPFRRVLIGEFASWWPLALLTPPLVAVVLRFRRPGSPVFRTVALHAVGAVVFTAIAGALMGLSESLIPWGRQPDGPLEAAQWGVVGYLGPDLLLYVMIVAAVEASAYAWESRQRAVAVATYERQLVEARLHVLSAQLQPHFLFNALHAISALVWQDPARADRLLARLSEMLRLTLRSGTRVETTLAEEVTLLQRYAEIQEARYGDRLKVSFEVEAGVREALVPRLILQPLVENAIRHGVTRRITPGQVDVRAWEGEGRLHLTVRDDGVGLRGDVPVREGVGLSITRERLSQLYGREQRFTLMPAPEGGAVCSLSIPLRMAPAQS